MQNVHVHFVSVLLLFLNNREVFFLLQPLAVAIVLH